MVLGYVNLPKELTAQAEEIKELKEHHGKLTNTITNYIETQRAIDLERQKAEEERRDAQESREELMFKYIDAKTQ